jgi:Metallo-peptidase family M12B Reprolysin-like
MKVKMKIAKSWQFLIVVVGGVLGGNLEQVWALSYALTVQPIQVCNDVGASCANSSRQLFLAETQKIWAQASINVSFLDWNIYNSSASQEISSANNYQSFDTLFNTGSGKSLLSNVLNMYFVKSISGAYGLGNYYGNGVAIADNVFSYNGGIGRLDTISHEIGHNLGLDHNDLGAGTSSRDGIGRNNLMTGGATRGIPNSINDIGSTGARLDKLTSAQVIQARSVGQSIGLLQARPDSESEAVPFEFSPALGLSILGLGFTIAKLRNSKSTKYQSLPSEGMLKE